MSFAESPRRLVASGSLDREIHDGGAPRETGAEGSDPTRVEIALRSHVQDVGLGAVPRLWP